MARVLYDVNCCLLTELVDLSFSLLFVCASYELDVYMIFELHRAIFTVVQSTYFCVPCGECIKLVKWATCCYCFTRLNLLYHDAM